MWTGRIKLAYSSEKPEESDGLAAKVLSLVDSDHGETLGVLVQQDARNSEKAA